MSAGRRGHGVPPYGGTSDGRGVKRRQPRWGWRSRCCERQKARGFGSPEGEALKRTITYRCSQCKQSCDLEAHPGEFTCSHCGKPGGEIDTLDTLFDHCPICQCRHFYLSKEFNRALGFLILGLSIILVPWTYGLSLPVCALLDWMLYKRVPTLVNCYQCRSEFKGFDTPKRLKPFDHHIGLRYDKYRK